MTDCAGDQKALFSIVDKLLHRTDIGALPSGDSNAQIASRMSDFFSEKIDKIWNSLPTDQADVYDIEPLPSPLLSAFRPADQGEIRDIIKKSACATCSLDPMPTSFVKQHASVLIPVITNITNESLRSGFVPFDLKEAVIKPLLKKPGLDIANLSNYRPVSNLPFLSKIIERVVVARLKEHMSEHNLCEGMQSAYKAGHSTETALVRVKNDILTCMDKNQCVLLVLLDLSAAFDTVNHSKLLRVLQHRIGLGGTALMWFESYLRERTQAVAIRDSTAPSVELQRGVPQGSVLGPILFTIYTLALGDIVRRHDLNGHFYADDMQLYVSFDIKDNPSHQVHRMEACIKDIKTWMAGNHLKLNDNKTEVITFRAPNVEMNMPIDVIQIGDYSIPPVQCVRDLGVVFDHHMTMHKNITKTCASCYFHLRNISSIRDSLTDEATIQLVHAFVSSRIDYCNSLLYGIPEYAIKKLQRVQNLAARVVTRSSKYSSITPTLKKLHWLPVKYRIIFKVVLLTFKALHGLAPNYLRTLLQSYIPSRSLRSETGNLLIMPKARRKLGCQSFAVAAPKLWNDLPVNIRTTTSIVSFRSSLKTHLFKLAYA